MKSFDNRLINDPATENEQAALEIIEEFFTVFHLVEAEEELGSLQQAILKIPGFSSGERGREDLVYFCEKLKELIGAAYRLKK
jgi:hypothetical protein